MFASIYFCFHPNICILMLFPNDIRFGRSFHTSINLNLSSNPSLDRVPDHFYWRKHTRYLSLWKLYELFAVFCFRFPVPSRDVCDTHSAFSLVQFYFNIKSSKMFIIFLPGTDLSEPFYLCLFIATFMYVMRLNQCSYILRSSITGMAESFFKLLDSLRGTRLTYSAHIIVISKFKVFLVVFQHIYSHTNLSIPQATLFIFAFYQFFFILRHINRAGNSFRDSWI